jgi:hypothetical protein
VDVLPGKAKSKLSLTLTPKSVEGIPGVGVTAGALTVVVSVAELLVVFVSVMLAELIVTALVKTVPVKADELINALKEKVGFAPAAMLATVPVTTIPPGVVAAVKPTGSPETEAIELGKVLVIVTPVAAIAPKLEAVIVYGRVVPAKLLVSPSVTETAKSVAGNGGMAAIVVVSTPVLFARLMSLVLAELMVTTLLRIVPTTAVLLTTPLKEKVGFEPALIVRFVPVTTIPLGVTVEVNPRGRFVTEVICEGSVAVIVTLVAALALGLLAVITNGRVLPGVVVTAPSVIVTPRSAGAPTIVVSVDELFNRFGSSATKEGEIEAVATIKVFTGVVGSTVAVKVKF